MRILVTGAAGFIGQHLISRFIQYHDHFIIGLDHSCGDLDLKKASLKFVFLQEDILNLSFLNAMFRHYKLDAVIHLAAQSSIQVSWKDAVHDATVNILGTINLLGLCQRYKVKRFVFASTSAVYAPKTTMPYMEDDTVGPLTPYGVSKAAAEHYIRISGLSYAILRLGNVYGPGQVPLGESILIARALAHIYQGAPFVINGDGQQSRDFVYVKDVARAFVTAVEQEASGIFNIAMGDAVKIRQILHILYNLTHFRGVMDIGGFVKPASRSFWKYGPPKKDELRDVCLSHYHARSTLGWRGITTIRNGLSKTVEAWPKP